MQTLHRYMADNHLNIETIRPESVIDELVALPAGRYGRVAMLVETPEPGKHVSREQVTVVPGKGFTGDHGRKSFYKGRHVPGREVTAIAMEVLRVLGVDPIVVGDNLITEGFDLADLEPGDTVTAGEVVLERSPREHRPCALFRDRTSQLAFDVVSRGRYRGALFVVRKGGILRAGDPIQKL